MQELSGHQLAHAEFTALSEFNHAPNGFVPMFPIEAAVLRKTGERDVEHFLDRAVEPAGQLLADDLLLLGFEFDGHTFNVTSTSPSCKHAMPSRYRAWYMTARRMLLMSEFASR